MGIFETIEKVYTSKEVADIIESTQSTVNRWAKELEECGYIFIKDDNNFKRLFLKADIEVYKTLKKLIDDTNMSVDKACKLVVQNYKDTLLTQRAVSTQPQETSTEVQVQPNHYSVSEVVKVFKDEFLNEFEQQKEFNQRLLERLDQQQKFIDERLEKRDKALMESIRLLQEQKEQAKNKRGFWARLFGK